MKHRFFIFYFIYLTTFAIVANSYELIVDNIWLLAPILLAFVFINLFAGTLSLKTNSKALRVSYHGMMLLAVFIVSILLSSVYHIVLLLHAKDGYWHVLWSALACIGFHTVLFWNGIICVYLTSLQLGIRHRAVGIFCGMIPVANIVALSIIIKTVFREVYTETEKEKLNAERKDENVCATRYPILMVHGVFFRDSKYVNYWGRIPAELEGNGARVYYGEHQSAASIAGSADELTRRIKSLVNELGCEKVNIIAHSKGGLDCRYAISVLDAAPYVASLTTVNTPHRGCVFADYLLNIIPVGVKNKVADAYNATLRKLGDDSPDFLAAVNDLTASYCTELDNELKAPEGFYSQSIGSVMPKASGGKFPLNFSYHLVKHFDGENDGLVRETAFSWGEKYTLLTPRVKRGISHGDMVDLNRENIDGFDVREFYVQLVNDLKKRGY